jgi:nucleoside-diphosphate-sugar epimerase
LSTGFQYHDFQMSRILIAGCGYVGIALGERLIEEGHTVWSLRRQTSLLPQAIRPLAADLTSAESLKCLPQQLDFIFYTAAAESSTDEAYRSAYVTGFRNLICALRAQNQNPKRLIFTSSTAVYAQSAGEWVDENSPTAPEHFSGRRLLEAEQVLLGGPFPGIILRLGGIYGPTRTRVVDLVRHGEAVCKGETHFANRIHRDDCVGILRHLMILDHPMQVYLGVDCEPAELCEVYRWIAARLGSPPPRVDSASSITQRKRRSNKRCLNARLLASGYDFKFPTFREGYGAILEKGSQESCI